MTPSDIETARAFVACEGWAWPWGCGRDGGLPAVWFDQFANRWRHATAAGHGMAEVLPDITDPRVLGWLLYLVRRAWSDQTIYCATGDPSAFDDTERRAQVGGLAFDCGEGETEAEALLAALQAAPTEKS